MPVSHRDSDGWDLANLAAKTKCVIALPFCQVMAIQQQGWQEIIYAGVSGPVTSFGVLL